MMDSEAGAGRGGKKNRMRQGRRKRSKNRGGGGGGGGGGNRHAGQQRYLPEPTRDESSILGARAMTQRQQQPGERKPSPVQPGGPPDAFALFCAYHLGITPDDGYQKPHADEIARRYGLTVDGLRSLLAEHKLDEASIRSCRFDLEGAQLDIRVAPEGISRIEMARGLYEDFLDTMSAR